MSSQAYGHGPPRVGVDGNRFFDHYTFCVQTNVLQDFDPEPWFRVDLQGRFNVTYIKLTTAAFYCGSPFKYNFLLAFPLFVPIQWSEITGNSFWVEIIRIRLKIERKKLLLGFGHFEQCENQRFSRVFCFQAQDACQMR